MRIGKTKTLPARSQPTKEYLFVALVQSLSTRRETTIVRQRNLFTFDPAISKVINMKLRPLHVICCFSIIAVVFGVCVWLIHSLANQSGFQMIVIPSDGTNVISYNSNDQNTMDKWIFKIREFLKPYNRESKENSEHQNKLRKCDYGKELDEGEVCDFDIKHWSPCTQKNNFSYHRNSPCVFLTVQNVLGWVPDYYNVSELPSSMPQELKTHINYVYKESPEKLHTVWVSCEGETKTDSETIGSLFYIPNQGFPGFFFPFNNRKGYLSPLVAINFEHPRTQVLLKVVCKAWAKNINHDSNIGVVSFELKIN